MTATAKKILLAEASPDLRAAARDLLAALGYEVTAVGRGARALDPERSPQATALDGVVVGSRLPDMDGLDLVRRLRRHRRELPALLLHGAGDDPSLPERALAAGVAALAVPFSAEALADALLEAFATGRRRIAEPAPALRRPARRRRAWRLAAAAVLAVAVGLLVRAIGPGASAPGLPAFEPQRTLRGVAIEALTPLGDLERAPDELAWKASQRAGGYRVQISAVDGTVLWKGRTQGASAPLPEEIVKEFQPAVTYLWTVEAFDGDGAMIARSGGNRFRIRPLPVTPKR